MLDVVSIVVSSTICAAVVGYAMGQNNAFNVERKNLKLEIQNKVLVREYDKLFQVIEHFKDKRNDLLVDDKGILIYYPLEEDKFIEELGLWANDKT